MNLKRFLYSLVLGQQSLLEYRPKYIFLQPNFLITVPVQDLVQKNGIQSGRLLLFYFLVVEQWKEVISAISKVRTITAMDYGFPSEDYYAKQTIGLGLC